MSNWYKIDDLLYRSAQFNEKGVQAIQKSGIKRVINLRQFHSDSQIAANTDLQLFQVGINPGRIKDSEIIKVLKIIKSSNDPVLVHCWHGSDRTGVVVAMYRILFQDWEKELAIEEMVNGGFGYHGIYKNLINYIRNVDLTSLRQQIEEG
ncbi:MAG: tyrosine-protein phosphatase [Parachlamydiaceae bacterium]|nr:tyrosine-protein phosphatase [Parachlamydiaceae bacterium]